MKYLIVPLTLMISHISVASDEWVSVGARPAATNASTPAQSPPPVHVQTPVSSAPAASSDNGLMSELLMQVEQMQQEIATLRGIVESQANDIRRLNQESEARYLDLDRRLVAVANAKPEPDAEEPEQTAQEAYKAAMALVREKKFEQASAAFEEFVHQWPDDELKANALYWAGEVFLVRRDPDSASNRFREVIDSHPNHIKAPDATYKYAMTLHKLGDADAARHWLETLITRYEGSADTTVQLAEAYLKKLPKTGGIQ